MENKIPSPSRLYSIEIEIDFELGDKEWNKIFEKIKMFPKCNGQCLSGYGPSAKPYSGLDGKCIYCKFEKIK